MSATARFGLPLLAAGQAGKEISHNEALQALELIAAAAVEDLPLVSPPISPTIGATYIVGSSATGDWAGKDQMLAGYSAGGWRFVQPRPGLLAYVVSASVWANFREGAWEIGALRGDKVVIDGEAVVGAQGAAIAAPVGGSTVDAESRAAIGQILSALRTHGLIAS